MLSDRDHVSATRRLQPTVHVIATTFDGTRAALAAAVPLARGSQRAARACSCRRSCRTRCRSTRRPSRRRSRRSGYRGAACTNSARRREVRVCLCRHADDVVRRMLPAHATVVVGGPAGTWRASREERLARRLTHLGHRVIFAPIEERPSARRRAQRRGFDRAACSTSASIGHFVVLVAVLALGMSPRAAFAQAPTNEELLQRIAALETQLAELKSAGHRAGSAAEPPQRGAEATRRRNPPPRLPARPEISAAASTPTTATISIARSGA